MAMTTKDQDNSANNNAGEQKQSRRQTPPKQQTPIARKMAFGLQSHLSTFCNGGEVYEKIFNAIAEKIKLLNQENVSQAKFGIFKMLNTQYGLNYSGIVITETLGALTSAHVLMIEKTGGYPDPIIENVSGIRYEITRTPGDAMDSKYVNTVRQVAAEGLKVALDSVTFTDGVLVPNEFNAESEAAIIGLMSVPINANMVENQIRVNGHQGVNIPELIKEYPNGKFFIDIQFNGDDTPIYDQTGLPIRQDICVALTYKTNSNNINSKSINQSDEDVKIIETYGYIDFEFTGPQLNGNVLSTQKFVPNFVITHMAAQAVNSIDVVLLGIASISALNDDRYWMKALCPSPVRKGEIRYNDAGALNIEGNMEFSPTGFGGRTDTSTKGSFDLLKFNDLMGLLVRPNILVSVDVPKAGPMTWYTSLFNYIKYQNASAAYARVNSAMLSMTNGGYQPTQAPMFTDIVNKIHAGYYRTKEGFKDLRHLGCYLGVANYIHETNQQPALISQYTNTLYNHAVPVELRAAERRKFIDEMSNKTAVYKQFYDRLTFNASWLQNAIMNLRAAGFAPMLGTSGRANDVFINRSTFDFTSAMLSPDVRLMAQNNQYSNFSMPYNYNRNFS